MIHSHAIMVNYIMRYWLQCGLGQEASVRVEKVAVSSHCVAPPLSYASKVFVDLQVKGQYLPGTFVKISSAILVETSPNFADVNPYMVTCDEK